jgi:hypothetical protein
MRTIELSPGGDLDSMLRKGETFTPDFHVFTSGIESDRDNSRLVHMVGSSTERDMQKDSMSLYALNDMTKADSNMTIWLNHDYSLPDSIFGSVVGTPRIMHQDGVADLHLNVDVELSNPKAAQVKKYIDNGRKLGCSIGCMVTKYEVPDPSDGADWQEQGINILGVYVVEYSVVGIPCNQRSWVENAIRGVFTRTYDPGLAPAMKSLWPSAYKQVTKSLPSEKRQELDELPSRSRPDTRLEWHVPTKTFTMSHGGSKKSLTPDQVKTLFRGEIPASVQELDASQDYETEELKLDETEVETKDAPDLDAEKAAKKPTTDSKDKQTGDSEDPKNDDDGAEDEDEDDTSSKPGKKGKKNDDNEKEDGDKGKKSDEAEHTEAVVEAEVEKEMPVVDEEVTPDVSKSIEFPEHVTAMLNSYNFLGKSIGLPEITTELYLAHQHPVVQEAEASLTKSMPSGGASTVQTIHDMVCGLGASCNGTQTVPQAVAQAQQEAGGAMYNSLGDKVQLLSKSIDAYSGFALDLAKAQESHSLTLKELEAARSEVKNVTAEIIKVQETINSLKNMPLGNPISHSRTVHAEDDETVVTREELLNIDGSKSKSQEGLYTDSLSGAFSLTAVKSKERGGQFMRYREWPTGVGGSVEKGVRPELTSNQIMFMDFNDIQAYRAGKAAEVPYLDTQVSPK